MLWFALGVIAIAGITLLFLRLWGMHEPRERAYARSRHPAGQGGGQRGHRRPVAPDDDEEFLRSLSRHREE